MKFLRRCFCLPPTRSADLSTENDAGGEAPRFASALHGKEVAVRRSSTTGPALDYVLDKDSGPAQLSNMLQEQGSWRLQRGDMTAVECVRYVTRSPHVSSGGAPPPTSLSGGGAGFFGQPRISQDGHAHEGLHEVRRRSSAGGAPVSTRSHRNSSGGSVEYEVHSCYFNPLVEGSAEAEAECDTAEAQEPAPQPVQKPAEAVEAAALMEVAAEVPLDAVHACSSGVSGRVTPGDALTKLSRSCSTGRSSWSSVSGANEVDVLAAAATAAVAPEAPATPLQCVSSQQLGLLHTLSTASSSSASGDRNSNQTLLVRQSASDSCEDSSGMATAQPAEAPASAWQAELAAAPAAPSTSGINADERLERAQAHKEEHCPAAAAAAGSFAASFSSAAGRRHKRTQSSYLDLAVAAERLSEALSEDASYICLLPPPALRPASPQKAHRVSSPAALAAYECLDLPQRQQPQMQTCNTQAVQCMESGGSCVGESDESTGIAMATSIANHAAKQATEEQSQEHSAPEVWPEPAEQVHSPEPAPCPQSPCVCGCMRAGCSVAGLCMTRALIKQMHLASRAALLPAPTEAPAEPSDAAGADTAAGHVFARSPFAAAFASAEAALMGRSRAAAEGSCDGGGSTSSSEGGAVVTCVVVIPRPGTKCQLDAGTQDQAPRVAAAEVGGPQEQEWLVARSTSSSSSESGESTASAALCSVHSSWRQPMTWTPLRERCAAARAPAPPGACVITAKGSEAVQAACATAGPGVSCAEMLTTGITEPSAAAWLPLRERYAWMTRSGRQRGGLAMETRRV